MSKTEKSYVYFGGHKATTSKEFKIGESANLYLRKNTLWSNERIEILRYVVFNGTKDERLFVESYLRSVYSANRNLKHFGNDHFKAQTRNNLKGAENQFFVHVAEAFAALEIIKHKKFTYQVHVGNYDRWAEWLDTEED